MASADQPLMPTGGECLSSLPIDACPTIGYRSAPLFQFGFGADHRLVYLPLDAQALVVANADMRLLSTCREFSALGAHVVQCQASGVRLDAEALRARLTHFARQGLLSPLRVAFEGMTEPSEAKPRISWVTIPALGDVDQLARCVRSCSANTAAFGHSIPVLVSDDSQDPVDQSARRDSVKAALGGSMRVYYVDRKAREDLESRLARDHAIPKGVLHFALFGTRDGPTYGANRNAILLYTQGTLALSLDQDVLCRTGGVETDDTAIKLACHTPVEKAWFCKDHEEALALAPECDVDVVAAHERVLGARVATLLRPAIMKGPVDLGEMCLNLAVDIATGNARVGISVNGVVGDSASENTLWVLLCPDKASRARLATDEHYRRAMTSRQIIRQCRNLTISHDAPWFSMAYGFDNRAMVPPFFPTFRSEDAICALIMARHLAPGYVAHLPWTLVHAPTGPRQYSPAGAVSGLRMCDLVLMCLSGKRSLLHAAAAPETLRSLGALLEEYGSLRQGDFDELSRILACSRASALMEALVQQLARVESEGLEAWADDLRAQIRSLEQAVVRRDYWVPTDVRPGAEPGEVGPIVRESVRQYGELLRWWPTILECAKQVLASGELAPRRLA